MAASSTGAPNASVRLGPMVLRIVGGPQVGEQQSSHAHGPGQDTGLAAAQVQHALALVGGQVGGLAQQQVDGRSASGRPAKTGEAVVRASMGQPGPVSAEYTSTSPPGPSTRTAKVVT